MREGNLLLLLQLLPPPASRGARPLYELPTYLLHQGCRNAAWEQHPSRKTLAEEGAKASVPRSAGAMGKGTAGARGSPAKQDAPRQSTGCAGAGGRETPRCPPQAGNTRVLQTHHPKGVASSGENVPPRHMKGPSASAPLTQAAP